jgi:hypothetical protein
VFLLVAICRYHSRATSTKWRSKGITLVAEMLWLWQLLFPCDVCAVYLITYNAVVVVEGWEAAPWSAVRRLRCGFVES